MMTRRFNGFAWRERGGPMLMPNSVADAAASGPTDQADDCFIVPAPAERLSLFEDSDREAHEFKWIESEKVGYDLGESALKLWVQNHWHGYLRARWIEHLEGRRFWTELDNGDFALLKRAFHEHALLLDRILDRLKVGQENLNIIDWAQEWHIPAETVIQILESLDINSRRLAHRFDPLAC